MTRPSLKVFRDTVQVHFKKHGRSFLWRLTTDPYEILVSEVMLQQTQVDRVSRYFPRFIERFPDLATLAAAPLREVLALWRGLGYNRRALFLKRAAEETVRRHDGTLPRTVKELVALPGIGPYTARAVLAFAFNEPHAFLETNIRAAYIHHFFAGHEKVADRDILPLVEKTVDRTDPRRWYYALMDYGAHLKKSVPNPTRRSATHAKQSRFEGSDRQIRGAILRALGTGATTRDPLLASVRQDIGNDVDAKRLSRILSGLCDEGMIKRSGGRYRIP
ncbi:MAG TPA: A/G-specific adenine glycosylase [bacterium]|nr:A/G-specific adenine glycosylase [bacterium]